MEAEARNLEELAALTGLTTPEQEMQVNANVKKVKANQSLCTISRQGTMYTNGREYRPRKNVASCDDYLY
jgi:hypothetical protein